MHACIQPYSREEKRQREREGEIAFNCPTMHIRTRTLLISWLKTQRAKGKKVPPRFTHDPSKIITEHLLQPKVTCSIIIIVVVVVVRANKTL